MPEKITEGTTLGEILKSPEMAKIVAKFRLPCLGCPMAAYEMGMLKIGDVCRVYGIDLKGLLEELNRLSTPVESE